MQSSLAFLELCDLNGDEFNYVPVEEGSHWFLVLGFQQQDGEWGCWRPAQSQGVS